MKSTFFVQIHDNHRGVITTSNAGKLIIVIGKGLKVQVCMEHSVSWWKLNTCCILTISKNPIQKSFLLAKSVTGDYLDTLGMTSVTIRLGEEVFFHDVQVVRNAKASYSQV